MKNTYTPSLLFGLWLCLAAAACDPYASVNYQGEPDLTFRIEFDGLPAGGEGIGGASILWPHWGDITKDQGTGSIVWEEHTGVIIADEELDDGFAAPTALTVDLIGRPRPWFLEAEASYLDADALIGLPAMTTFDSGSLYAANHDLRVAYAANASAADALGISAPGYALLERSPDSGDFAACLDELRLPHVDCDARCRVSWAQAVDACDSDTACVEAATVNRDGCDSVCGAAYFRDRERCDELVTWVETDRREFVLNLEEGGPLDSRWLEWELESCAAASDDEEACVDRCGLDGFGFCAALCLSSRADSFYCGPEPSLDVCVARRACAEDPDAACLRRCEGDGACVSQCEASPSSAEDCADIYDPFKWCEAS